MLVELSDLFVLAFHEFVHSHLLSLLCLLLLFLFTYLPDIQLFGLTKYSVDLLVVLCCIPLLPWVLGFVL